MARRHLHKPEDAFYRDLGQSIQLTRNAVRKSQTDVAEHIGVTFQQLQKYEKGVNRIPVLELTKLAAYLKAPPSHFRGHKGVEGVSPISSQVSCNRGYAPRLL